jgi:hypothetical protein
MPIDYHQFPGDTKSDSTQKAFILHLTNYTRRLSVRTKRKTFIARSITRKRLQKKFIGITGLLCELSRRKPSSDKS